MTTPYENMVPTTRTSDPSPEITHLVTVILGMTAEPTVMTLRQNGIATLEIFMSSMRLLWQSFHTRKRLKQ